MAALNMFGYYVAFGANSTDEMLSMGEHRLVDVPPLTEPDENSSWTQEAVTEPIHIFEGFYIQIDSKDVSQLQSNDWKEHGYASLCDQSLDHLESIRSDISHMSDDLAKQATKTGIPTHIDETYLASQSDDIPGEDDNATMLPVLGSAHGDGTEGIMDDLGYSLEVQMTAYASTFTRSQADYDNTYGGFSTGLATPPQGSDTGPPETVARIPHPGHPKMLALEPIHNVHSLNSTGEKASEKTVALSSNKSSLRTLLPKTKDTSEVS
ncbi:hypothetical protein F503_02569 [Ophiostoma piceae UAMH 11346]|uniref:Uncharacterized protein n=1 Tax=Ophiostoma piceae (strain UAMH 11346) TaxID=1262450 RepID=S3C3S6_OPHP1|nr:hypothetical protein F503_02569 [Ophiostoma piceae UAMH 11346]